jgi:hypothetical protein
MEHLIEDLPSIWREVHTQLLAFAKFLVRLEKDV